MKCAPSIEKLSGTCISTHLLEKMYTISTKSPLPQISNPISYREQLVKSINTSTNCSSELCWLTNKIFFSLDRNSIIELRGSYRPIGPTDDTWLNTININQVMKQYSIKYSDFEFIGALPRDFDDFYKLTTCDWNNFINNNKTKIGIIFNHDTSNEDGSHWVSLYIDFKIGGIYYFDSIGRQPKKEIRKLINSIKDFMEKVNITPNIIINNIRHQHKNTECGVYSIAFIIRLLDGEESVDEIIHKVINDDTIQEFRTYIFNKSVIVEEINK